MTHDSTEVYSYIEMSLENLMLSGKRAFGTHYINMVIVQQYLTSYQCYHVAIPHSTVTITYPADTNNPHVCLSQDVVI